MDYETKFILERIIQAVDSPDGWTIALTGINTIAIIVIAIIQIRIQKQQTKLQKWQVKQNDYELNKELLMLVKSIDKEIENLLFHLFIVIDLKSYSITKLSNFIEQIEKLESKLVDTAIDFELRFPNGKQIVADYRNITIFMSIMYRKFIKHISNNNINTNSELDIDSEVNIRKIHNDEVFKNAILNCVKDKVIYNELLDSMNNFILMKKSIQNKGNSKTIVNHCKIDSI